MKMKMKSLLCFGVLKVNNESPMFGVLILKFVGQSKLVSYDRYPSLA